MAIISINRPEKFNLHNSRGIQEIADNSHLNREIDYPHLVSPYGASS